MNSREKLLVAIVAAIAVVGTGWGARRLYVDRTAKLEANHKYEQNRLKEAKKKLDEAQAKELEWKAIGRQTLSTEMMVAKGRFRVELTRVATESGFPVPPTEISLIGEMAQGRNRISVLVYQVKAEGTIDQIVSFLHNLYRQPYLVRCKSISLKPVMNKPSSPTASPTPTGRLSLTMSVETPVLPSDKRVPKIETAELAPDKRVPVERPDSCSLADYRAINRNLFRPYQEANVVVVHGDGQEQRGNEQSGERLTDRETVLQRPADSGWVLARVLSSPLVQQVVLEDPANKTVPDKRVEVGEALYNGTLIFVHVTGAVSESAPDGKRLFHPVGAVLEEGQELSAARHPKVFEALKDLEQRIAVGAEAPAPDVKGANAGVTAISAVAPGLCETGGGRALWVSLAVCPPVQVWATLADKPPVAHARIAAD